MRHDLTMHQATTSIDRIQVISWLGYSFYMLLLFLDFIRMGKGIFYDSPNYLILFLFHIGGVLYLIPAFLTTFAGKWCRKSPRTGRMLIWYSIIVMTVLLMGQSLITFLEHGRVTLFVIYVLVTNWAIPMNQNQRILFNLLCSVGMSAFIVFNYENNLMLTIISLYETVFYTLIAFIFATFDYRLKEENFRHQQTIAQEKSRIEEEKARADKLLLNVLPQDVINQLLTSGKVEAREYRTATVLFTDFIGFTDISGQMSPHEVLEHLNTIFTRFDNISEQYDLQKIKTLGDAYIAAGNLSSTHPDIVRRTVLAALEMQAFTKVYCRQMERAGRPGLRMRVGVHTGTISAGIVGFSNFHYDIWGDAVNVAGRLEQACAPGKVNVSPAVYHALVEDTTFVFEARGKVYVKGKGEMQMWHADLHHEPAPATQDLVRNGELSNRRFLQTILTVLILGCSVSWPLHGECHTPMSGHNFLHHPASKESWYAPARDRQSHHSGFTEPQIAIARSLPLSYNQ